MSLFWLALGFGVVSAAIIALSATAFSLQYSVTAVPNFMHGEFLTLAAYGMLVGDRITNTLWISVIVGMAVAAAVGWAMNVGILEPFIRRGAPTLRLLVITVTVGVTLQSVTAIIFTVNTQTLAIPPPWYNGHKVGPFVFTVVDFIAIVAAIIGMFAVHVLLKYTKLGKAQRAVADSRELAAASGISVRRIIQITWILAGAIAGLAGILLAATQQSFDPFFGFNFLLVTLSAAVVGGIGRPYGAMLGALIIGLVTAVMTVFVNSAYDQIAALAVLLLVLLVRPNGLLGAIRERA